MINEVDYQLAGELSNRLGEVLTGQPTLECIEALCIKLSQSIGFGTQRERDFIAIRLDRLQCELGTPPVDWDRVPHIVLPL
jgi:hypothetical protein